MNPQCLLFLVKSNCIIVGFTICYFLFLRKLTFFQANRFFLLSAVLLSVFYSLTDLSSFWPASANLNIQLTHVLPQAPHLPDDKFNYHPIVSVIIALYWVGVIFTGFRFLLQLISLIHLHKKSSPGEIDNYLVRTLHEQVPPFSFGRAIYLNPSLYKKAELASILAHEKTHVQQLHTIDILLSELLTVFFWYNPLVWQLRKAIRQNLEYYTDNSLMKQGFAKKVYQYSLLEIAGADFLPVIVNRFNVPDLKKRIKMMNTQRSPATNTGYYALPFPLLFLVSGFDIQGNLKPESFADLPQKMVQVLRLSEPSTVPDTNISPAGKKRGESGFRKSKTKEVYLVKTAASSPGMLDKVDFIPGASRSPNLTSTLQEAIPKINLVSSIGPDESTSGLAPIQVVKGVQLSEQHESKPAATGETTSKPVSGIQLDDNANSTGKIKEVVVLGFPSKKSVKGQN